MSETPINVQDVSPSAQGSDEEGKLNSVDKMPENNQLAYETYKKALDQRHKFKSENEDLKARLERIEQEKLEAEGKTKEALEYWKNKAQEETEARKKEQATWGWNQVKGQLTSELAKQGCVDPDVALSLIDKQELESVEVDDQYRVASEDLSRIVDGLRKNPKTQKIRLFASSGVNDITPGIPVSEGKDLNNMSKDEILAQLKA